jgi:predicted DNA-binding transcriptional regulator AlpA
MPKPPLTDAEPHAAFTIKEFCQAHGISVPFYYELKKSKHGPVEMRMGALVRISAEAAAAWRHDRENPDKDEAEATATTAKAMKERALRAARKAVESPKHVSNKFREVA